MSNQEHLKLSIFDFNFLEFLRLHYNDFIVFATGSWDYTTHTGSYHYTTHYKGRAISRFSELHNLKSPDVAMLLAIKDACEHIRVEEKNIFFITPTQLGFHIAERGKGANRGLVEEIIYICNLKALNINTLAISGGSDFFKAITTRYLEKTSSTSKNN